MNEHHEPATPSAWRKALRKIHGLAFYAFLVLLGSAMVQPVQAGVGKTEGIVLDLLQELGLIDASGAPTGGGGGAATELVADPLKLDDGAGNVTFLSQGGADGQVLVGLTDGASDGQVSAGTVLVGDGSVSAPAVSFSNAPGMGFSALNSSLMALSIGGVERYRIGGSRIGMSRTTELAWGSNAASADTYVQGGATAGRVDVNATSGGGGDGTLGVSVLQSPSSVVINDNNGNPRLTVSGGTTALASDLRLNDLRTIVFGSDSDVFIYWDQATAGLLQVGTTKGGTDGIVAARPQVPTFTVATLPAATTAGQIIYVSDGAAGSPILAFSDGTDWLRVDTATAVSSS